MLLNENELKTLIKDIIKEVRDDRSEELSDDLLIFPDEEDKENKSLPHEKVLRNALRHINKQLNPENDPMKEIRANTPIYAYNGVISYDDSQLVINAIITAYKNSKLYKGEDERALDAKIQTDEFNLGRSGREVLTIEGAVLRLVG